MTDKPKPRRRWLQFSLRTMMIVVTVFCVWLGFTAKRARDQRQAVEVIRKLWGAGYYEHQLPLGFPSKPPGPKWLRRLIGDEYFFSFGRIEVGGPTDADLVHLKALTSLTFLALSGTKVTDTGLEHLKDLTNLQTLELRNTHITDTGLEHLIALTDLEVLVLTSPQITDAGLVHLKGFTKLERLYVNYTQVTDEGVKKLQQALPNCKIDY